MLNTLTAIKTFPKAIPKNKISTVMYKFNQSNQTSCQVDINDIDCKTVMIKGAQSDIDRGWELLIQIVATIVSDTDSPAPTPVIAEWISRSSSFPYLRSMETCQGDAIGRFEDGRLFLIGAGALLVDALDWIVRQFGKQEGAVPFFAEPVWRSNELHKFGYPENSLDLCRIDHFDQGRGHYWQNAACDNIWKSLSGKTIDKFCTYTTMGTCCRNERSQYYFLERLKVFRMREIVAAGSPSEVLAFRERALDFVRRLNDDLQMNARLEIANDPFFIQDEASVDSVRTKYDIPDLVKIEYRPEIYDGKSLACASFNVHGDFFAQNMGYGGSKTWTSCAAFGLERLAWAVLIQHGHSHAQWPASVKTAIEAIYAEKQG